MSTVDRSTVFGEGYGKEMQSFYGASAGQVRFGPVNPAASGTSPVSAGTPSASAGTPSTSARASDSPAAWAQRRNRDVAELSTEWNQTIARSAISDLFGVLSKDYPGIVILERRPGGTQDVRQMAAELGQGSYVVVSSEFLERMGRSRKDFEACKSALKEALRSLSSGKKDVAGQGIYLGEDKAASWYVPARTGADVAKKMAEALKQKNTGTMSGSPGTGAKQPESEYRKKVVVSYSTMNHFAGLARAGSKSEVKKVMGDAQRSIGRLRLASVYGDEKERVKARKALRSLQKLLARGSRKIRKLDQEELLGVRKKRAEKARKEKKVRQIQLELKKRRSARKGADYRLIQEGLSDTYRILGGRRDHRDYEAERLEGSVGSYSGGFVDAGAAVAGGMEFTAAEVIVSSETTF